MKVSVGDIARAIHRKELDPILLAQELLDRISKYDKEIRAYIGLNSNAIEDAKKIRFSDKKSKIAGIPFSVKDLIDTSGITTTYGAEAFQDHVPARDATVVKMIKTYGGYVLGKTNTHQYALGLETPPTRNPWDRERIPGGSSGGSAAAISADLALVAVGTDTGGSIRIPAAMCGVTGLKPTFGKISTRGIFPTAPSMDHAGPLCRFASDLPEVLAAMGYRIRMGKHEAPLRVGLVRDFLGDAEPGVRAAVTKCFNLLESEHLIVIDEIDLPGFSEACWVTETIDTYETALIHRKRFAANAAEYNKTARELIDAGLAVSKLDLVKARRARIGIQKKFAGVMKKYPVLGFPTLPRIAPTPQEINKFTSNDFLPIVRPLELFDLLGYPAISVPCGFVNGLPVGVHLSSYRDMDDIIIGLTIQYQKLTNWHIRTPHRYKGFSDGLEI